MRPYTPVVCGCGAQMSVKTETLKGQPVLVCLNESCARFGAAYVAPLLMLMPVNEKREPAVMEKVKGVVASARKSG